VRDGQGRRVEVSFQDLVDESLGEPVSRADLHLSRTHDGEIFLTSRQDGVVEGQPGASPMSSDGHIASLERVGRIDYRGTARSPGLTTPLQQRAYLSRAPDGELFPTSP
jgi:hypothetical protein